MKSISKIIGIFLMLFGFSAIVFSQDIITLRTGDEVKAIINTIEIDLIRYKKFENPTGPLYSLEKDKVFMIKYENGIKEVFEAESITKGKDVKGSSSNPTNKSSLEYRKGGAILQNAMALSREESRTILSKIPDALESYNSGVKLLKAGSLMSGVGLATSLGVGLLIRNPSFTTSMAAIIITSGALTGSIVTTVTGRKKIKKSVILFNSSLEMD